tara:strand:- start:263 stop:1189 length:927 start_codon:yes stop_codon:yes gene_type:complete
MNVLITGCAGFIGSHATDVFLESGHKVVGVDLLTYAGNIENIHNALQTKDFVFYKDDICNTDKIIEICLKEDIEWIINFAAETHVDNSIKSASSFVRSNVDGVRSLLDCCVYTGAKFFQISTDEVYGSIGAGSFRETDNINPRNPYSATKAAAEIMVEAYRNTHKIEYKIVRMSNNFGPRQNGEKFLPTIIRSLLKNQKIPVYGDGKNVRDWLYVRDCAHMVRQVLLRGLINQTYNLTHRNEKENIELIRYVCELLEKDFKDSFVFIKDRKGHDFRYSICNKKILSMGVKPPNDFRPALLETIDYYRK